ncbi:MAG: sigma-70 family RNA polymerase sigma factor [Methylococcaceae bacterium]|nr:sigma-70 family RNA polymerase sigma factor [Methylococcaceae bacterium]
MLHTNISATHKTYQLNDTPIDVSGVFTAVKTALVQPLMVNISVPKSQKADEATLFDSPEHFNIILAKDIAKHRNELTTRLSEIPLTALWLLNKYGQKCYIENDTLLDNDTLNTDEQITALADRYHAAQTSAQQLGFDSPQFLQSKQQLSEALQSFPYTAEQLKAISTIVSYAYYLNTHQVTGNVQAKTGVQAAILKRMQKLVNLKQGKLANELKQLGLGNAVNPLLADFLLPPDTALNTALLHLIGTEECWLNARQKLAQANNRLVLYLANQYKGGFLDFNDLVQEGQSGLLKAVDRFDHLRGFKFSTYAVYWIRQGISRSLTRNERVVRLPFGQMANIGKLYRAKDLFYLKTGREISLAELAEQTELSEAEINVLLRISQTATSLDTPVGDDDNGMTLSDFMEQQVFDQPLNKIAEQELTRAISTAINSLSEKEAKVICCRFGLNSTDEMTLEDIGHELNLTRERVRQIQVSAINKLKQHFGKELLSFL